MIKGDALDRSATKAQQFEALWHEQWRVLLSAWRYVAVFLVVLVAGGVYIDHQPETVGLELLYNILSYAAGYFLLIGMIVSSGIAPDGRKGGFGAYFVVGILSGLGLILGFLLLVIPGLVLIARWAPAYGYALIEGEGVTESLSRSWHATEPFFWPIMAASVLVMTLMGVGLVGYMYYAFDEANGYSLPWGIASNTLLAAANAMFSALGLAIFSLIERRDDGLPDIFE